jgi:hypothetical protein
LSRSIVFPLLALALFGILAVHTCWYEGFVSDDALISLRYAERFAAGKGLTWNDGEQVEGYSNLLWVLITSIGPALGIDTVLFAQASAFVLTAAGVAVALLALLRLNATPLGAFGLSFFVVSHGPTAAWIQGGLEQSLILFLIGWALFASAQVFREHGRRVSWLDGLPYAGLILARPDSAMFLVVAVLVHLLYAFRHGHGARSVLSLLILPVAVWSAQMGLRWYLYNDWVPNTARVKVVWSTLYMERGLRYVLNGLMSLAPLIVLAIWGALSAFRRRARNGWNSLLALVMASAWLLYLVLVGGDVLPAKRHMIVLVVLAVFAAAPLVERESPRKAAVEGKGSFLLPVTLGLLWLGIQSLDAELAHLRSRWVTDAHNVAQVGPVLERAFRSQQPLIAVDQAGATPYYTRFPSLDMLGLTDRYLTTHLPKDFGSGWIGHELGNGRYVLDREPDLVFFGDPLGGTHTPVWRSGKEMIADVRWQQEYQSIFIRVRQSNPDQPLPLVRPFVRVRGRVGLQSDGSALRVTPLLLGLTEDAPAELMQDGTPVFNLPGFKTVRLPSSFGLQNCSSPHEAIDVRHLDGTIEIRNVTSHSVSIAGLDCTPSGKTSPAPR